jgi:hypothetical protein
MASLTQIARARQAAVRWLYENEPAITDPRDCAVAISALVAAEHSGHSSAIQHLVGKLRAANPDATTWNDEVWDTVWAVRALLDQQVPRPGLRLVAAVARQDPQIWNAIRFLKSIRDRVRGFWYGEPFETLIAVDLLHDTSPEDFDEVSADAIKWLVSIQSKDGRVVAPHFTGIFASVFTRLGVARPGLSRRAAAAAEWLVRDVADRNIWTSAAWSNAHALQGLIDAGLTHDHPAVRKVTDWFVAEQSRNGSWSHVATVDDTSMAVLALSMLLREPLIDVAPPRSGTVSVMRTNGSIRLTFDSPAGSAMVYEDFKKLPPHVADKIRTKHMEVVTIAGRIRSSESHGAQEGAKSADLYDRIARLGEFAHGQLLPDTLDINVRRSRVDHIRLNIDESLIDLPWELIHDGEDFLCTKYALGRHLYGATVVSDRRPLRERLSALVVSDPKGDLPGARTEGVKVASLLRARNLEVTHIDGSEATAERFALELKRHAIVHYAGHAWRDEQSPDESGLVLSDGYFEAFQLEGFFRFRPPALVFLNACSSASERSAARGYPAVMRGLARTFLTAGVTNFIGYLIPVSDDAATDLALYFYTHLTLRRSVGEALRRARVQVRENRRNDPSWASAVLYGDPSGTPMPDLEA